MPRRSDRQRRRVIVSFPAMTPELRRKLYPLRRRRNEETRRSLLASLRGADWIDRERIFSRTIADAVRALLAGVAGDPHREERALEAAWPEIVSATLAAHCRPGRLRNGRLLVLVDHSTWMHFLTIEHKRSMLDGLARRFPELRITEIHFRLA